MVRLADLDPQPELATEFNNYALPFLEVRRWQNNSAFATKDFKVGDTVMEESPFLLYSEEEPNPFAPTLARAVAQARQKQISAGWSCIPSEDFFQPLFIVPWQDLTTEKFQSALKVFYSPENMTGQRLLTSKNAIEICSKIAPLIKAVSNGEDLFKFLQILDINIHKDGEDPLKRTGLYVIGSKFSHSCEPNCVWEFKMHSDSKLQYVATRDIKCGELLTFSYLGDGFNMCCDTLTRQISLRHLNFVCSCTRCQDRLDLARGTLCKSCGSEDCYFVNRVYVDSEDWQNVRETKYYSEGGLASYLKKKYYSEPSDARKAQYAKFDKALTDGTLEVPLYSNEESDAEVGDVEEFYEPVMHTRDKWFCLDCGHSHTCTKEELDGEVGMKQSVPRYIDSPLDMSTRAMFIERVVATHGKNNFAFILSTFGWLQSAMKVLCGAARVNLTAACVAKKCLDMQERAKGCIDKLWVQRLRLAGLVAHIERAYNFPPPDKLSPVKRHYFFPNEQFLPLTDPLGVGLSLTKCFRHRKFSHLHVLIEEDDTSQKEALVDSMVGACLKSGTMDLMAGEWTIGVF